ncbi:hypothetical protein CTEN210_04511 [Chaetoceros tenuissimus]|uniref:DUF6824 domain-containing protein n=1 Tax=Chaetoceros tenuissimus TaxID=426638 RepID=A0AAD3H2K3_9STRA|nr:hypothetical protein CTEN210_04511 [Chaetoceros tenuissimus]
MKCGNDNEEQEPVQTTIGEHVEKLYKEVYRNAAPDDPEKESRLNTLERGLRSEMSGRRPHRGYAVGTTAAICMEVFEKNPNYKAFSPRSRSSLIYVMKCGDDNEEQQEPVPTTIGKHIEKVYDEVYPNAAPDDPEKETRLNTLERDLISGMYSRRPHGGYAIGTTAAKCMEVLVYTLRSRSSLIYVMKCGDDNEEQQEPVPTTIGKHIEKVYDEVYPNAAPDDPEKETRLNTLERDLISGMYSRRPHGGYAIGTTAATCKEVAEKNRLEELELKTESENLPLITDINENDVLCGKGGAVISNQDINENDVLCGKGGAVISNQGNISFQKYVKEKNKAYQSAKTTKDKERIANEIKDTIQNKTPSGRFLKKSENGDGYIAIDDENTKKKIQNALRDCKKSDKNKKEKAKASVKQLKRSTSAMQADQPGGTEEKKKKKKKKKTK